MQLLKDQDANLEAWTDKTVAVLGYGNQGRAQALNLRDSGIAVVVGNRNDAYRDRARVDGFEVLQVSEASARGEVLLVLTTDESQPLIWDEQIAPWYPGRQHAGLGQRVQHRLRSDSTTGRCGCRDGGPPHDRRYGEDPV